MRRFAWLLLALPACTVEEGPPPLVTTTADAGEDGFGTEENGEDESGDDGDPEPNFGSGCRGVDEVELSPDAEPAPQRCGEGGPCPTFEDVTEQAGLLFAHTRTANPNMGTCYFDRPQGEDAVGLGGDCSAEWSSAGGAVGDVDGDGLPDLYFSRMGAPDKLFRNLGDGSFEDISDQVGFDTCTQSGGGAFADLDRDGDLDLLVTGLGAERHRVYRNRLSEGEGFEESAADFGLDLTTDAARSSHSAEFGDYDQDGRLDVIVHEWVRTFHASPVSGSRMMRGTGSGFQDVTYSMGLRFHDAHESGDFAFSSAFVDLDDDGLLDMLVAGDFGASRLYWNQGSSLVVDAGTAMVTGLDTLSGMGMTVGDIDGDADLDWFITGIYEDDPTECDGLCVEYGDGNRLLRNDGGRNLVDATDEFGVRDANWAWGTVFVDIDNDTDLDLIALNGWQGRALDGTYEARDTAGRIWENDGSGHMTALEDRGFSHLGQARTVLPVDYDLDGDVDLVVTNHGDRPVLYRNDGGNEGAYLRVQVDVLDVGAKVLAYLPGKETPLLRVVGSEAGHFGGHGERVLHFGLGNADVVERLEVWRPGDVEPTVVEQLEVDQTIELP